MTYPSNPLFTYDDYVIVINDDNSGYNVVNTVTNVVEIEGVDVLVQARAFAKDIAEKQKAMNADESPPENTIRLN
jgi:hypothetical protein